MHRESRRALMRATDEQQTAATRERRIYIARTRYALTFAGDAVRPALERFVLADEALAQAMAEESRTGFAVRWDLGTPAEREAHERACKATARAVDERRSAEDALRRLAHSEHRRITRPMAPRRIRPVRRCIPPPRQPRARARARSHRSSSRPVVSTGDPGDGEPPSRRRSLCSSSGRAAC